MTKERRILITLVHYYIRLRHFTVVKLGICLFVFVCLFLFVYLFAHARYIYDLKCAFLQLQKFVAEKTRQKVVLSLQNVFVATKSVAVYVTQFM